MTNQSIRTWSLVLTCRLSVSSTMSCDGSSAVAQRKNVLRIPLAHSQCSHAALFLSLQHHRVMPGSRAERHRAPRRVAQHGAVADAAARPQDRGVFEMPKQLDSFPE